MHNHVANRHRRRRPLIAGLLVAFGLGLSVWLLNGQTDAPPATSGVPEDTGGSTTPLQVTTTKQLERQPAADRQAPAPPIDPAFAGTANAHTGAICVEVVTRNDLPVAGISVELVPPPRPSASSGQAVEATTTRQPPTQTVVSDKDGRCLFSYLRPAKDYVLVARTDRCVFFEATPNPFRRLDGSGPTQQIEFDGSELPRGMHRSNVSGAVPATADTVTRTRLLVAEGATIRGIVQGQAWDEVTVDLVQTYRSVGLHTGSANSAKFTFADVFPIGSGRLLFEGRRDSDYYFGRQDLGRLADGQVVDVTLQPWDPNSATRIRVRAAEGEATPPGIHIVVSRSEPPHITSDFIVEPDRPITLHGMFGAKIISLEKVTRDRVWRRPEITDVTGLRNRMLVEPEHEILVRPR